MKKKILAALATASVAVSSIAASVSAANLGDSTSVKPEDVSNVIDGKVPTTGDASTTLLIVAGAVAVVALTTIIVAVKTKKTAK